MSPDWHDVREPYRNSFEAIYEKAQAENVTLNNSKEFLNALSEEELTTLQNYALLVDPIQTQELTSEGAYNLLLHHYEKYDFNGDGVMSNGKANMLSAIPLSMPNEMKQAVVDAFNQMDAKETLLASIVFMDPMALLDPSHQAPKMDFNALANRIDNLLNPKNGEYSTSEFKGTIEKFWNLFQDNYTGDQTRNEDNQEENGVFEELKAQLLTKGAAQFLAGLNQQKIEAKVEEFKEKLIDQGVTDPQTLEKQVADYRKQLLEELQHGNDGREKTMPINAHFMLQKMLEVSQKSGLEALLQPSQGMKV
jgi:dipeptidase